MLKAVFYARFHPERGPSVIHQYPKGSIRSTQVEPLLAWSDISSYIIPPYDLCNQALSICTNGYRVLAHPMSPEDPKYDRNRFTFNVCFVLSEDEDAQPWEQVVRKTAEFFTAMEEEDGLLQAEEMLSGLKWAGEEGYPAEDVGIVHSLLEGIVEDMNAYGETCVRIDDIHVLNLRLEFPIASPQKVRAWDVPLLIRSLPIPTEWTWDLTLQRIYAHIDGIRHVQKISELADSELKLVKRAVKELVHHGRAMLLDIFHFQAIYTCNDSIAVFVQDEELQDECRRYVAVDPPAKGDAKPAETLPSRETVVELFCLLQPGMQLTEFCINQKAMLRGIDVRRLITFGVIKGFLRRVHKYALAMGPHISSPIADKKKKSGASSGSKPKSGEDAVKEYDRAWRKAALSSGWSTPPPESLAASLAKSHKSADAVRSEEDEKLIGYLDGKHCMDQICVEMHLSERKVVERLRSGKFGDVVLFNK